MTKRDEQVQEIRDDIERMQSLAEAENLEALEELAKETEEKISALKGVGVVDLRKNLREEAAKASKALREPAREVAKAEPEDDVPTYAHLDGVSDLVTLGADKAKAAFTAELTQEGVANEIAELSFQVALLSPLDDRGVPDIKFDRQATKDAVSDMLRTAAGAIAEERGREATDEEMVMYERIFDSLTRKVKYHRSSVRGRWLQALDSDEAARAKVAPLLEGKPDDVPVSQWVADSYGVNVLGEKELAAEKRRLKREGKSPAATTGTQRTALMSPTERLDATLKALPKAIIATPADMEAIKADDDRRARATALLDAQMDRLRALRIQLDAE